MSMRVISSLALECLISISFFFLDGGRCLSCSASVCFTSSGVGVCAGKNWKEASFFDPSTPYGVPGKGASFATCMAGAPRHSYGLPSCAQTPCCFLHTKPMFITLTLSHWVALRSTYLNNSLQLAHILSSSQETLTILWNLGLWGNLPRTTRAGNWHHLKI